MISIYNPETNQVKTFIREDYGRYVPPPPYVLVEEKDLPGEWTRELDTSGEERLAAERREASDLFGSSTPVARALRSLVAEWVVEDRKKYNDLIDLLRTRITVFNTTERSQLQALRLSTDPAEVRQALANRANSAASD